MDRDSGFRLALTGLLGAMLAPALTGQQFAPADSIVRSGIRRGVYSAAVLIVGSRDRQLHASGFGHLTWAPESPVPDPDSTLWDLASLTKVVATTPAVALLVDQQRIALDDALSRYLPRFHGGGRGEVTVRQLLLHRSGLPSYRQLFREAPTADSALTLLYQTPLRTPPGAATRYSDLGFMLLGELVGAVAHEPLDRFVSHAIFEPLGMANTGFRPAPQPRRTAPTGRWRGQPVCCTVNDQNAARLGGVAGHAGLFATGHDLARYARLWLNHGSLGGVTLFAPAVADTFLAAGVEDRVLGWERANPDHRRDSAFGTRLSPRAYGHTGWTGTLIWIDPDRDLFLVFLTNRSYAPRVGNSIRVLRGIRGALSDAVIDAVAREGSR